MKRRIVAVVVCVLVGAGAGLAQQAPDRIPGLILSDLHLISQESLSHWTSQWTGPIQAATIAAWFAEHGYPALLRDYNGDGVVDELDTIELADRFGEGETNADAGIPPTDPRVSIALAEYIASLYPNEFVMKIYDPGFPGEYASEYGETFASDVVAGIEITIKGEPTVGDYMEELAAGEGVIVGLEERDGINTYFSGRSFMYDLTPEGFTPVDFAWSKENRVDPGHQGSVLDTVAKMDDRFYVDLLDWVPVEFMLALSPTHEPDATSEEGSCPDDAIAYDETTARFRGQEDAVRVTECVTREDGIDTYTYTVTNLSYESPVDGCGICAFGILNPGNPPGLTAVAHSEPMAWMFSALTGWWLWQLPASSCGVGVGESAVFSISVPGPTVDGWSIGLLGGCYTGPGIAEVMIEGFQTTGPQAPRLCPDLIVENCIAECVYNQTTGEYTVTVTADVTNIGSEAAPAPHVTRYLDSRGHEETYVILDPIDPGESHAVAFQYEFAPAGDPADVCPLSFRISADDEVDVQECDEGNNSGGGEVCCPEPPEVDRCPDLVVDIRSVSCEWECPPGMDILLPRFSVVVTVKNVGNAGTGSSFKVTLGCCGMVYEEKSVSSLAPTQTKALTFDCYGLSQCETLVAVADSDDDVVECDEDNNEDSKRACCPPREW